MNLARCNYLSKEFHFAVVGGNDLLCINHKPVLGFLVGIPHDSSLLEKFSTKDGRFLFKDCSVYPLNGEIEKIMATLCVINGSETAAVHAYGGGLKIGSRITKPRNSAYIAGAQGIC